MRRLTILAALAAGFLAGATTWAASCQQNDQQAPITQDPAIAAAGMDFEKQLFGDILRIGDGKEQRPLFKFNLALTLAQYVVKRQSRQHLRLCEYSEHVASNALEVQQANRCLRSALTNLGRYSEAEGVAARAQLLLPGTTDLPGTMPEMKLLDLQWLANLYLHQGSTSAAEEVFLKINDLAPVIAASIRSQPRPADVDAAVWDPILDLRLSTLLNVEADARGQLATIAYYRQDFALFHKRTASLLATPGLIENAWAGHAIEQANRLYFLGDRDQARTLAGHAIRWLKADAGFRDQAEPLTEFNTHYAINGALGDETVQPMHVESWIGLARAYMILDRDSEALALLGGTERIAKRYLLEPESASTLLASVEEAQADLAIKNKNWPQAVLLLRAARTRLQNAQTTERSTEQGRRSLAPHDPLLQIGAKLLVALLQDREKYSSDLSHLGELASIAAEASSSRAQVSAMLASRSDASRERQSALVRENQLIDELIDLRGSLAADSNRAPDARAQRSISRIAEIYSQLAFTKASQDEAVRAGGSLSVDAFAAQLGQGTAYWQWLVHPVGNFVICWTSSGLSIARLDRPIVEIRRSVGALQATVNLRNVETRRQLRPYPDGTARALHATLFGVLLPEANAARSWLLANSSLLDGLPWGALRVDDSEAPHEWLIERADLTVVPSWKAWLAIRARPQAAGPMRLLAIGDPLLPAVPSSFTSDFAVRGAYVAKVLDIPPVPPKQDSAFAKELRSVAALFPRNRTKVLTGAAATKQELASLDLRQFNMLLFSTHGYLGKQFSISIGPSLELTESGAANSRFLTASEVAKFQLDADLVVLSACDTSGSDGFADSEGFSGLTSAFLLAGARDVIATLWPVETETTKELITDTLRYRVQDNHSVSKALQRAAIDMINSDKAWQRHPAFWAPFLVVGK